MTGLFGGTPSVSHDVVVGHFEHNLAKGEKQDDDRNKLLQLNLL